MSDDDLIQQWATRRQRVQDEEAALQREIEARRAAEQEAAAVQALEAEELTEEELLAKWELPNPDTVVSGDDVSVFFREGVPEFLRRRALRSLWPSNPILANLDGLNDYDGDFTISAPILASSYEAGLGYAKTYVQKAFDAMPDATTRSVRQPEPVRALAGPKSDDGQSEGSAEEASAVTEASDSDGVESQYPNDALQNASRTQEEHTVEVTSDRSGAQGDEEVSIVRYPARMQFDPSETSR